MRDVSYALRTMRKSPGFTLVAVLTLALGIGANTAVFSLVHALLLRPLPLPEPDRLMFLTGSNPARPGAGVPFSLTAYETVRDGNRSLSGVTAFCAEGLTLTGLGDPVQLTGSLVSPNFFEVLRVQPLLGRGFQASEGEAGGKPVVLISRRLWENRFAGDPAVLGRTVTLGQDQYTIIGVMPPDFPFPFAGTDVWATRLMRYSGLQAEQIRNGAGYLAAIARLKPGVTASQADAEVRLLGQGYRRDHPGNPDADPRGHLELRPLQDTLVADIRPTLLILTGAVGFVLLIACANVASLTLARAGGRAREMVIRSALGAGRGTLIRQLLAESVMLAMAGALVGILLADWGVSLLGSAASINLPGFQPIRVDLPVLGFTFAVSLATGVLFGLVPALEISRPDLNRVLRGSGRRVDGRRPSTYAQPLYGRANGAFDRPADRRRPAAGELPLVAERGAGVRSAPWVHDAGFPPAGEISRRCPALAVLSERHLAPAKPARCKFGIGVACAAAGDSGDGALSGRRPAGGGDGTAAAGGMERNRSRLLQNAGHSARAWARFFAGG